MSVGGGLVILVCWVCNSAMLGPPVILCVGGPCDIGVGGVQWCVSGGLQYCELWEACNSMIVLL